MRVAIAVAKSSIADGSGVTWITVAVKELPNTGPVGVIDNAPWSVARPGPATPKVQVPAGQNQANPLNSVIAVAKL